MKKKPSGPGRKLLSALTQEQIGSLLDAVGPQTLLEKITKNRGKADADMADTVKAVLQPGKSPRRNDGRVASGGRLVEEWHDLWNRWDDIIEEVGDEDGNYSIQDHHWEEPYFDGSAVALDLEKVGAEMYKQIDAVYDLVNDPDIFTDAMNDIEDAIKAYPEWMGAGSGDGCTLEHQTTLCVLKWLWLSCKDQTKPGAPFIKKMEALENRSDSLRLNGDTVSDFITGFPEPVCREIHDELQNGRFREEQEKTYSPWNTIAHEFERRYDKGRFFERCGRDLEKNWRHGGPLIKKAMREKDWERAESWLVKTFASYRQWHNNAAAWYPEKSLLVAGDYVRHDASETARVTELLGLWAKAGESLGNSERSIAAQFQATVVSSPEQLNKIIAAFKELRNDNSPASLSALFTQWQDEIVRQSLEVYNNEGRFLDTWIHWAIGTLTEIDGRDRFRNNLDTWLDSITRSAVEFKKQWELLACLTDDLADSTDRRKSFPGLFKTAIERSGRKSPLDKSRMSIVRSLCRSGTAEIVMEVWKKQFVHIVPDPAESSNDYLEPVAWAKTLLELNPEAYSTLVQRWHMLHHRRRNLWEAMRKAQLSVDF